MKEKITQILMWFDGLKNNKTALYILIVIDLIWAVCSNIADFPWLSSVPLEVLPFAPICSLYPLLLLIWFILKLKNKRIPTWFTTFIFFAITSYGIMTWIYYPFYMSWTGVTFRLVGNMFWVTVYALQSLIIKSELKRIPVYQYVLVLGYFVLKDISDRFWGSFIDILQSDFPEKLLTIFTISIVTIHIVMAFTTIYLGIRNSRIEQKSLNQ